MHGPGPDQPSGRRFSERSLALCVVVFALASWLLAHRDLPFLFFSGDDAEYAEMGRRIATGRGFTTGVIFPIEVRHGVGADHPALLRPPGWPLLLAAAFRIGGADAFVAHLCALACYVGACLLAALTASRLAHPLAGLCAGVAVALAPDFRLYASMATTESLTALLVALLVWLWIRKSPALVLGLVCGLLYLTRYNTGILLPLTALSLFERKAPWQRPLACLAGFAFVCAPWWIRNFLLTSNPFFSVYNVTLWETPLNLAWNGGLLYALEPDLNAFPAITPLEKMGILLPLGLRTWPVPAANLAAFAGLLLGAVRRERACVFVLVALLVSKLAVVPFAVRSRYEVPFIPAAIAVGVAALWRHAGRLRAPALGLVLAAPFLPTLPDPSGREQLHHAVLDAYRQDARSGGAVLAARERDTRRRAACLAPDALVVSHAAAHLVWETGSVAIYTPRTPEDLWQIVDRYPIRFAVMKPPREGPQRERFERSFAARPDCAPDLYERRLSAEPQDPPSPRAAP